MTIFFNPFVPIAPAIAPVIKETDSQAHDEKRRIKALERHRAQQRQQGEVRRDAMQHALAVMARSELELGPAKIDFDEHLLDDDLRDAEQATGPTHEPSIAPAAQRRDAPRPQVDLIAPRIEAESAGGEGDREFIDAFFTDAPAGDDERRQLSSSLAEARAHVRREALSPRAPDLPHLPRSPQVAHEPQVSDLSHAAELGAALLSANAPARCVATPRADARVETAERTAPPDPQSLAPPAAAEPTSVASDEATAPSDDAGADFLEAFCADSLASSEDMQQLSAALDHLGGAVNAGIGPSSAIQAAVLAHHGNSSQTRTQGARAASAGTRGDVASVGKSGGRSADIEETLMRACAALPDQDAKKALLRKFIDERRTRAGAGDQDSSGARQADAEMVEAQQASIQSRQAGTTLPLETVRNV